MVYYQLISNHFSLLTHVKICYQSYTSRAPDLSLNWPPTIANRGSFLVTLLAASQVPVSFPYCCSWLSYTRHDSHSGKLGKNGDGSDCLMQWPGELFARGLNDLAGRPGHD